MKRVGIIFMLTLMITLSFCACKSDNNKLKDITNKYANDKKWTAVIKINNTDSSYKISLTKNSKDNIQAEIIEPETLKGFWVQLNETQYKIGYKEIETSFAEIPAPANSVMKNIFEGINLLEGKAKELSCKTDKSGNILLSGKLENGLFANIIFDKAFLPKTINFDNSENLCFEFESFNINN